jgi:hypothetical protein
MKYKGFEIVGICEGGSVAVELDKMGDNTGIILNEYETDHHPTMYEIWKDGNWFEEFGDNFASPDQAKQAIDKVKV